jgi:hypothetical protein
MPLKPFGSIADNGVHCSGLWKEVGRFRNGLQRFRPSQPCECLSIQFYVSFGLQY